MRIPLFPALIGTEVYMGATEMRSSDEIAVGLIDSLD
jgi:hypothetical protein